MALPEVKGIQFETNEAATAASPKKVEVKGLQFETNEPATALFPRGPKIKGIMFETPLVDVGLEKITFGNPILGSGRGTPSFTAGKGSLYMDKDTATLFKNIDGAASWQVIP